MRRRAAGATAVDKLTAGGEEVGGSLRPNEGLPRQLDRRRRRIPRQLPPDSAASGRLRAGYRRGRRRGRRRREAAGMWDGGGANGKVLGGCGGGFRLAGLRAGGQARAGKERNWRLGVRERWLVLYQMHLVM